jgi:hypothetical protein
MRWQDFVPIISPFVTFLLGIISGGYIIPRLTTKRKLLDWAILDESDLFPKELTAALGVPVRVLVGGGEQDSLSRVHVRLGGGGSEIIENTAAVVRFNKGCRILHARPIKELGEFSQHVRWSSEEHSCRFELDFLNPRQVLDLEFLLSGYEPAAVEVDASAAGLEVRRRESGRWEMPTSFLQGIALNLMGIHYDPSVAQMRNIAEELRGLRRQLREVALPAVSQDLSALPSVSAKPELLSGSSGGGTDEGNLENSNSTANTTG